MSSPCQSNESDRYNQAYFDWQKNIGQLNAWANADKFKSHIAATDVVLDFGCGGGYLLKSLNCQKRLGIEVNLHAAETAQKNGLEVFQKTAALPDQSIDVVISNNTLEHTLHPLDELQQLHQKLKTSGKAVFVVPCESIRKKYKPDDISHHLYSWSPMCIGNLFTEAGFRVISTRAVYAKWPPYFYKQIAKYGGKTLFKLSSEIYGRLDRSWFQVKVIAQKD